MNKLYTDCTGNKLMFVRNRKNCIESSRPLLVGMCFGSMLCSLDNNAPSHVVRVKAYVAISRQHVLIRRERSVVRTKDMVLVLSISAIRN